MKVPLIALAVLAALPAGAALADDDCHAPREAWQPREAAMQAAAGFGWRIDKIEADDGCWEVKGVDAQGARIKARLDPATLQVVKLRQRVGDHDDDGDDDRKRDAGRGPAAAPAAPAANPLFQKGAPPVVRVN